MIKVQSSIFKKLVGIIFIFATPYSLSQNIQTIAFGSCVHQDKPQPIWDSVLKDEPDVFIFLGDNIYGDSTDPRVLKQKYQKLGSIPGFKKLQESTRVLATWDDHDYGLNDAGIEYPAKNESRELMLNFWGEDENSPRRSQAGGIYASYLFESLGKKVQIILLDTRWNRTPIVTVNDRDALTLRDAANLGPYEVNYSKEAELLGEIQWQWLEQELQVDADLRIIGSSIQVLSEFTGWESWANFPRERIRMIDLLKQYQQEPIIFISGDVHWAEFSEIKTADLDWPITELTSSGLTEEWKQISPNRHRVGNAFALANYGVITIDWEKTEPEINLLIKDKDGKVLISHKI